MCVIGEV